MNRPRDNDPLWSCDEHTAEAVARQVAGALDWQAHALESTRARRSFVLHAPGRGDLLVRLAPDETEFKRDLMALEQLADPELSLAWIESDVLESQTDCHYSAYAASGALRAPRQPVDLTEVAELLAALHDLPSLALMRSFPEQDKPTNLAVLQRLVEQLRSYLLYRRQDGLPADMLTLQLADLGRVVRRYVVAQDHYFLPHPRRVLCHGAPGPDRLLRDRRGLHLFGFEHARLGDAARDLALYCIRARLDESDEALLIEHYLDSSQRQDDRFIVRCFAHRTLALLERPVARLLGLYRIKYEGAALLGDPVQVLLAEMEHASEELAEALTLLNTFLGHGRPYAPRDVRGMGRLVSYEELLLRDGPLVVAIEGASYTGKTPVATQLATRLGAGYLNPGALVRAGLSLAGVAPEQARAEDVARALASHDLRFETVSDAPHYRIEADGEGITEQAREPELYPEQQRLLADPASRATLAAALEPFMQSRQVIEGEQLDGLVPETARRFALHTSEAVRASRHAEAYAGRAEEPPPLPPTPPPADCEARIDSSEQPFPQIVLELIQLLLPDKVRQEILVPDFTGRRPMFES